MSLTKSISLTKRKTVDLAKILDPSSEKHQIFLATEKDAKSDPFNYRIYNMAHRVHTTKVDELLKFISQCEPELEKNKEKLIKFLEDEDEFIGSEISDIEFIKQCSMKLRSFSLIFLIFRINLKIRKTKDADPFFEEDDSNMFIQNIQDEEIEKTPDFMSVECILERSVELQEMFPHFLTMEVEKFVRGKRFICLPAVKVTLKALAKILMHIKVNLNVLTLNNNESFAFKQVLIHTMQICKIFDFLFGASLDDEDDIMYKTGRNDDTDLLLDCLEFSTPKDPIKHKERLLNGLKSMNYYIAVANRGFQDKGFLVQCTEALSWAFYYKNKEKLYKVDSETTLTMLHKDRWSKVMNIVRHDLIKKRINAKDTSYQIGLNTLIYIPNYSEDRITLDNIEDTNPPTMMDNDLDLPFSVGLDLDYDQERYIQVRVNSNDDWNRIDWYYGTILDPKLEPIYYDAIIIHYHGGGFILGSSGEAQPNTIRFCKDTGYPIFSVDYRLAPEYKYPDSISDCFMVYCWILNYAEKYLRIKFGKILLYGESAGGNCLLGVASLCIQKGIQPPDGIVSVYAAIGCGMNVFSPSLLYSLDDPMLNCSFLVICCEEYLDDEAHLKQHYTLSPKYIPVEILEKFPPVRMIICGLDPLRDEQIRFVHKCATVDVDVQATEYRYLTHMCLGHNQEPYNLREASKMLEQISYYLSEIGSMY